jgi:[ribosomal protein S18]-alanine N-acetyltransferase
VTGLNLRAATPADVAVLTTMEREVFGDDAWTSASVTEELTGPGRWARVACGPAGAVVGYAVTSRTGDVVDLHRVVVVPRWRRRGVAHALLTAATAAAAEAGAERMLLEVSAGNDVARAFYAAHGFQEIHRRTRYYRDGSDALVLAVPVREPAGGGRRS